MLPSLNAQEREELDSLITVDAFGWPFVYINHETGKFYRAHHQEESDWVNDTTAMALLCKGGEGSGKSVTGIIRDLDRLKSGLPGALVSPDLPHFKKSLWPEFKRWCPIEAVIQDQRYRLRFDWEPSEQFQLSFLNGATLICGGIEEPGKWEGPNLNFVHFDEARRTKTSLALKTLLGRIRIPHPDYPPSLWLTTTPKKHWLYDYFGPWEREGIDPLQEFKERARVLTLKTQDNEDAGNVSEGYTRDRGLGLTPAEKRVLQDAEWEDIDDVERFLTSIIYWDSCQEMLPALTPRTPMILAADAGVINDCFGLVGVTAHPTDKERLAVRLVRIWKPGGKKLDFDAIEVEIVEICKQFNIISIAYDQYQLHQMMNGLYMRGVVLTEQFEQNQKRLIADKALRDMIMRREIAHDGQADLREHLDNADVKKQAENERVRIVKRTDSQKIDLCVALSMAAHEAREYNL